MKNVKQYLYTTYIDLTDLKRVSPSNIFPIYKILSLAGSKNYDIAGNILIVN